MAGRRAWLRRCNLAVVGVVGIVLAMSAAAMQCQSAVDCIVCQDLYQWGDQVCTFYVIDCPDFGVWAERCV